MADAPPPPLQIAAAPVFALFCSSTFNKVMIIRTPEQPRDDPGIPHHR
jgi:hypothetical protein